MSNRTCTMPECPKKHVARGYCKAHYNKIVTPDRHRSTKPCEQCGRTYTTTRTGGRFCSLECYTDNRWGNSREERELAARAKELAGLSWRLRCARAKALRPVATVWIPAPHECGWCGHVYTAALRSSIYCTSKCKRQAKRTRRRAREHSATGSYTWAEVVRVYLAIGGVCAYCHEPVENRHLQPDHVIALSRGGVNSITNVVPSCGPCNADKRDLTLSDWASDRLRRGLEPRSLHPEIRHLTSVLIAA